MHFFLRLLIAFDKLPSREIVPIYTPTSRDWHPGRLWVVNERKLRGEKAGREEKEKGREAWRERMQGALGSPQGPALPRLRAAPRAKCPSPLVTAPD